MSNTHCPVCGNSNHSEAETCHWDLRPVVGLSDSVQQSYQEQLEAAKEAWQSRSDCPELEQDAFETDDEFCARLTQRVYFIGTVRLDKSRYHLETGTFPLIVESIQDWAKPLLHPLRNRRLQTVWH